MTTAIVTISSRWEVAFAHIVIRGVDEFINGFSAIASVSLNDDLRLWVVSDGRVTMSRLAPHRLSVLLVYVLERAVVIIDVVDNLQGGKIRIQMLCHDDLIWLADVLLTIVPLPILVGPLLLKLAIWVRLRITFDHSKTPDVLYIKINYTLNSNFY